MRYYAYVTESCWTDAQRTGHQTEVNNLADKVEWDQSIATWDRFPPPCVKKSLGAFRLVAAEQLIGENLVICFLALMARGDARYDHFQHDPPTFVNPLLPSGVDLTVWLDERTKTPAVVLPAPTPSEYSYLYDVLEASEDQLIYETTEWVHRMAGINPGGFSWIHSLLVNSVLDERTPEEGIASQGGATVLYRRFPALNRVMLVAPFFGNVSEDEIAAVQKRHRQVLTASTLTEVDIRKQSARAYPQLVLADAPMWLEVQQDNDANLALSPEEAHILDAILHHSEDAAYPLFINGRPGSGKSTILQLLFAHHLHCHLSRAPAGRTPVPPLYLTYSARLLNAAKAHVTGILRSNAKTLLTGRTVDSADLGATLEMCFAQFHDFLRNLLPPEERDRFQPAKRVAFARFRELWERKARAAPSLRKLSSELVWHVIRSFIKGRRDEGGDFCDPDRYAELPLKQRSVTQATYKAVFTKVWEAWYRPLCAEEGLWDDQDLARQVLDVAAPDISRYPAIFCDEAQDFTRIELELIVRLSLFSRRLIKPDDLIRVPFAFAGDPFQTINPTGFQWPSVQAGFHEQIVQELDRFGRGRQSFNYRFNYQELASNYRSTKSIVGFCNVIQLLRGILFGIGDLRPQLPWFEADGPPPTVFRADDPEVQDRLREEGELVIILPCQEGMEDDFVRADPFLAELAKGAVVRNFLSSMSAKGLEFARVALYKFGAEYLLSYPQLLTPLRTGVPHGEDPEQALPLEYYINRLYVAASRPRKRLLIVDTEEAITALWHTAALREADGLLARYARAQVNGWTREVLAFTQPGSAESWSADRDDPLALAQKFREEGMSSRNPYLLTLAEANFQRAKKPADALQCRALRLEIEGDLLGAGSAYRQHGDVRDAARCFWRGGHYPQLLEIPEAIGTLEHRAAQFMTASRTGETAQTFLAFLFDEAKGPRRGSLGADPQWTTVCIELVHSLGAIPRDTSETKRLFSQLQGLIGAGMRVGPANALATIALEAGEFGHAVQLWERDGSPPLRDPSYQAAKAEVEPFPASIRWLHELKEYGAIISVVERNPKASFSAEDTERVVNAYGTKGNYTGALRLAEAHALRVPLLKRLHSAIPKDAPEEAVAEVARALLQASIQTEDLQHIFPVLDGLKTRPELLLELEVEIVYDLALPSSPSLRAAADLQDRLAKYLRTATRRKRVWTGRLIRLFGAAIERTTRINESLEFYEDVWKAKRIAASPEERRYAELRWCRCKYRQSEHTGKQGKTEDAERQRAEAQGRALKLSTMLAQIPEYPEILKEDEPSRRVDPTVIPDIQRAIASLAPLFSPEKIAELLHIPADLVRDVLSSGGSTVEPTV